MLAETAEADEVKATDEEVEQEAAVCELDGPLDEPLARYESPLCE